VIAARIVFLARDAYFLEVGIHLTIIPSPLPRDIIRSLDHRNPPGTAESQNLGSPLPLFHLVPFCMKLRPRTPLRWPTVTAPYAL